MLEYSTSKKGDENKGQTVFFYQYVENYLKERNGETCKQTSTGISAKKPNSHSQLLSDLD